MNREDFIFTSGFQGASAVVDRSLKRRYKGAQMNRLLEDGLYAQAFRAALYDGGDEQIRAFASAYAERTGEPERSTAALKRLFGVFAVPEHLAKNMYV
jgi:hypothetical protein